jgi:L-alanine-DL-glutamate epimerase-like enolase superfamily enzyme
MNESPRSDDLSATETTMKIEELTLYRVAVPLYVPYVTKLHSAGLAEIDTIVCEVRGSDGRRGVGDTTILEGYTHETREGGWKFCVAQGERLVGMETAAARKSLDPFRRSDPHAVSALQVAIEMLEDNPLLRAPTSSVEVPILGAVNSKKLDEIPDEVERLIADGFRTLKIKVGWTPEDDLKRVRLIQKVNAGRAKLRIDANQGYSREDGIRFATSLESNGELQLFEQPCNKDDWESNAAVAAVSNVPLMMDESIYGIEDVDRAATMKGCGFVKLKISKLTGVDMLKEGLDRIRERGMVPVLGNGAASDIGCFVEACIARVTIDNAGENNGYLKNSEHLFVEKLPFRNGNIILTPDFKPELDYGTIKRLKLDEARFAPVRA